MTEEKIDKICLKCLRLLFYESKDHCSDCGRKLVRFGLHCDCGEPVRPFLFSRVFPPWGKSVFNKYCPHCGRNIEQEVWDYIRGLKKANPVT